VGSTYRLGIVNNLLEIEAIQFVSSPRGAVPMSEGVRRVARLSDSVVVRRVLVPV